MPTKRSTTVCKLSKLLTDQYDVIIFEDLNIKGMVRNHRLSKSILDKGWGQLKQFSKYKAKSHGKIYHEIDRFFPSSKLCSTYGCGHKQDDMDLKIREWVCPKCHAHHCRDVNASVNILRKGLSDIGYLESEIEGYIAKQVMFHTTLKRASAGEPVDAKRHSA